MCCKEVRRDVRCYLRGNIHDGTFLPVSNHFTGHHLAHIDHLLHVGIEHPAQTRKCRVLQFPRSHQLTYRSKSSGTTEKNGLQMATAALLTRPSMVGRVLSVDLVVSQSVRSSSNPWKFGHSACRETLRAELGLTGDLQRETGDFL